MTPEQERERQEIIAGIEMRLEMREKMRAKYKKEIKEQLHTINPFIRMIVAELIASVREPKKRY